MPVEAANILRRAAIRGDTSHDIAALAHVDLLGLTVDLFPYEPFAARVWELRTSVTSYDAWYVALAEALDAPLATLDEKLARAPGPRCNFLLPTP
jgi:predicted nucleic acid-binding protein